MTNLSTSDSGPARDGDARDAGEVRGDPVEPPCRPGRDLARDAGGLADSDLEEEGRARREVRRQMIQQPPDRVEPVLPAKSAAEGSWSRTVGGGRRGRIARDRVGSTPPGRRLQTARAPRSSLPRRAPAGRSRRGAGRSRARARGPPWTSQPRRCGIWAVRGAMSPRECRSRCRGRGRAALPAPPPGPSRRGARCRDGARARGSPRGTPGRRSPTLPPGAGPARRTTAVPTAPGSGHPSPPGAPRADREGAASRDPQRGRGGSRVPARRVRAGVARP